LLSRHGLAREARGAVEEPHAGEVVVDRAHVGIDGEARAVVHVDGALVEAGELGREVAPDLGVLGGGAPAEREGEKGESGDGAGHACNSFSGRDFHWRVVADRGRGVNRGHGAGLSTADPQGRDGGRASHRMRVARAVIIRSEGGAGCRLRRGGARNVCGLGDGWAMGRGGNADGGGMDELSIDGASAIQQNQLKGQVDVAIAKKTLDAQREQGDAAIELLKSAAETARVSVKGGRVDGYA